VSLETTTARIAAQAADGEWRRHLAGCPPCTQSRRSRAIEPCPDGRVLLLAARDANAKFAAQLDLDRQPLPGQEPLF
jgi:hypothetical protein